MGEHRWTTSSSYRSDSYHPHQIRFKGLTVLLLGTSKNSVYPSLLEKGDGLRPLKAKFLEVPY
jgi:hypothetical protein